MLAGAQRRTLIHSIRRRYHGHRGSTCEMGSIALNIRSLSISRVRFRSSITNPTLYEAQLKPAPLRRCSSERQGTINNVFYDFVRAEEVETAWEIEKQGFPPEEADNLETLRFHQRVAPELFVGAYVPSSTNLSRRRLIAYTYATLSTVPHYTQESLTTHTPGGTTVCGHTLCLDKEFRGASIGLKLFVDFVHMCRRRGKYDRMVMMAKKNMISVYERMGFVTLGKAEIVFGKEAWYEMSMSFHDTKIACSKVDALVTKV